MDRDPKPDVFGVRFGVRPGVRDGVRPFGVRPLEGVRAGEGV